MPLSPHSAGQGSGIVTITAAGTASAIDDRTLAAATALITEGLATAVSVTPGGDGSTILAVPADVVLVAADALREIRPEVLDDIAGAGLLADPRTAMLDLQWRLSLFGHRVRAVDGPLAPLDGKGVGGLRRRTAAALNVIFTNLGDDVQPRMTSAAQLYLTTRAFAENGATTSALDLERSPGGDDVGHLTLRAGALAGAFGIDTALDDLDALLPIRRHVQARRRIPDRALGPALGDLIATLLGAQAAADRITLDNILTLLGITELISEPVRVLVVGETSQSEQALRLETALTSIATVRHASTVTRQTTAQDHVVAGGVAEQVHWADVVVLMSANLDDVPGAESSRAAVVADLSRLDVTAWLVAPGARWRADALRRLMGRADLVIAADARQRDLLLGALAGQGRLNPMVYDDDPTLLSLVRTDEDGTALVDYCAYPLRAADRASSPGDHAAESVSDRSRAVGLLREGGLSSVMGRAAGRVRRLREDRAGRTVR